MGTNVAELPPVLCANVECKVALNGKCVEGLALNSCPFYGKSVDSTALASTQVIERDTVSLNPGTTLSLQPADAVTLRVPCRVLALIGAKDAGKSSLIASLYDLFQTGAVGKTSFSGSMTLPALEELCHNARAASRRSAPHFERTPHGPVRFYHIELAGENTGNAAGQTVLFGDRAGEDYRSATDDPNISLEFPEVRRADSLTFLVDGKRLLASGDRHNVRSEVLAIAQAFVESGILTSRVPLALVLTKMDLVDASDKKERVKADYASIVGLFKRLHAESFFPIEGYEVAAYPPSSEQKRGVGIEELLSFWLNSTRAPLPVASTKIQEERAFARLHCEKSREDRL